MDDDDDDYRWMILVAIMVDGWIIVAATMALILQLTRLTMTDQDTDYSRLKDYQMALMALIKTISGRIDCQEMYSSVASTQSINQTNNDGKTQT